MSKEAVVVSMNDVAARASVSIGTVSKYVNSPHRVAEATQARIREAIDALGYMRNEAARQLKTGRSRVLAFVALELNHPYFSAVAEAMERRASENGLFFSIVCAGGDADREAEYVRMLVQQRVYGVLLASGLTRERELNLLLDSAIPTVLMDAYPESETFSSCWVNDFAGARMAVTHLIAEGSTRIAFVGGSDHTRQITERLRGATNAIESATGVSLEVIPTADRSLVSGLAVGEELVLRDPADRPDAVFAANDSLALGIIQALSNSGTVRVPEDIAVVGYDDIDFAAASTISLTSVRRPREEFGQSAVDLLRDQAESPTRRTIRQVVIQPELVIRKSSLRTSR